MNIIKDQAAKDKYILEILEEIKKMSQYCNTNEDIEELCQEAIDFITKNS